MLSEFYFVLLTSTLKHLKFPPPTRHDRVGQNCPAMPFFSYLSRLSPQFLPPFHSKSLRSSMSTESLSDVITVPSQTARYRPALQTPDHIREHCHIYLDEQLCTKSAKLMCLILTQLRYQRPDSSLRPRRIRCLSPRTRESCCNCAFAISHRTRQLPSSSPSIHITSTSRRTDRTCIPINNLLAECTCYSGSCKCTS